MTESASAVSPPKYLVVLDLAWMCAAIISGVFLILVTDSVVDLVNGIPALHDMVKHLPHESLVATFVATGYMLIFSGAIVSISAFFTFKGTHYGIVVLALLASSGLSLLFIAGIFGFVVLYLTMSHEESFKKASAAT